MKTHSMIAFFSAEALTLSKTNGNKLKGECVYVWKRERKRETPAPHEARDRHEYLMPLAVAEVTAISTSVLPAIHSQLLHYWHN